MRLLALLAVGLFVASPALAQLDPINADANGLALRGYDAVAYFTLEAPTPGNAAFSHMWNGATWHFSTAEHRDLFIANPEQYAPQFGGYCAWAVSRNYTADADPEVWTVVDGKLYVNYNRAVGGLWSVRRGTHIKRGHENWPGLLAGEN
ncbi:MAG: YHS domain-containing (seleno)protein [Bacteroidota bacterium]